MIMPFQREVEAAYPASPRMSFAPPGWLRSVSICVNSILGVSERTWALVAMTMPDHEWGRVASRQPGRSCPVPGWLKVLRRER